MTLPMSWLCPDLRPYWQLGQMPASHQVILQAVDSSMRVSFSEVEGYALRHFTGQYSIEQIQTFCQQQYGEEIPEEFVITLLQNLITLGLLTLDTPTPSPPKPPSSGKRLKPEVEWIAHPNGYWILRNPVDVTFLQVSSRDKAIVDQLEHHSPQTILQSGSITAAELQHLLKLLTATAMFEGTTPPKPPKGKFTPLKLLFFKFRLCNPDPWLSNHVGRLHWLWTKPFLLTLLLGLSFSGIIAANQGSKILHTAQQLMHPMSPTLALAFLLLSGCVVTLHELGHAFTLKHYQRTVPEMGIMIMCLMPVAYTNTTDQYSLPKQQNRLWVVGAGVMCQVTIAAVAFWVWNSASTGSWLWFGSYLTMMAAIVTVTLNLNPLAKFDGYYLAVALTGINNLRTRSFQLYQRWLRMQPSPEQGRDRLFLALYAPFSLLYTLSVFGLLVVHLGDWVITNIPATGAIALILWLIYFIQPTAKSASH
jgi:putative peptide zinc metalloprotease protein